jgi:hypothetical protein
VWCGAKLLTFDEEFVTSTFTDFDVLRGEDEKVVSQ